MNQIETRIIEITDKSDEAIISIKAEVASSYEAKLKGLTNIKKLDDDRGMLFLFTNSGMYNFWMKEVNLPLDILFIDSGNVIVHIKKSALSGSTEIISPPKPVQFVLEVNAGLCETYGISVGCKIKGC